MKLTALTEFKNLQTQGLFSFKDVQAWLLKYEAFYKDVKYNWHCPNSGCQHKFTGCCSCDTKPDAYLFVTLYDKLLEFSHYEKYEAYALGELNDYNAIKHDASKVKSWVIRNENIAGNACFEFLMNYHAYNDTPTNLLVVDSKLLGYDVFVSQEAFKSLVQFLETFDELFWIQKIYPESDILCVFD
ncbi:hypothetical protein Q4566_13055 [Tamlana sp. 2_MG-2023]|uniref:hypothetical protein n=1 Tax=unclassified Tamlana TaxID=2614803 RepID=UPI0026E39B35|nr:MULTISPECIES: hypothetical protein [unclassified Tamlana]MDO6761133.1 hypothetical protein [Tamlana sp. 2_MG-2023]MDO6791534.1 hypothetical protein [Tamlana sp. 1_MG-2023]